MQHVIGDQYTWMFLNQQSIYHNYFSGKDLFSLSKAQQGAVINKLAQIENNMSCTVRGGHFFFVGRYGAEKTAYCINRLYGNIKNLQDYLESFS